MVRNEQKGKSTRDAMINAGLRLFGESGYDATSTRQIALAADANISAISYHFGGKEGLRLACAEHVAKNLTTTITTLAAIESQTPEEAAIELERIVSGLVQMLLLQPQAKTMSQFMLREVAQAEEVLDIVFPKFFEPIHKSICQLWAQATGQDADSDVVMLSLFAVVGQVIYFRVSQEIVRRRLKWDSIGPTEVKAIESVILTNLRATLEVAKKGSSQ